MNKATQTAGETAKQFNDIRGKGYEANNIKVIKGDSYYCGMPVTGLKQTDTHLSKHFYSVESLGTHLGTIALNEEDVKTIRSMFVPRIDFTRVAHDVNGNPRHVCHFLAFINEGDEIKAAKEKAFQELLKVVSADGMINFVTEKLAKLKTT